MKHVTTQIFAYPGDGAEGFPFPATHWFYQIGNRWMAVQNECEGCWFEDGTCMTASTSRSDWPAVRSYPIDEIPPSGDLLWRDETGTAWITRKEV